MVWFAVHVRERVAGYRAHRDPVHEQSVHVVAGVRGDRERLVRAEFTPTAPSGLMLPCGTGRAAMV